VSAAFILVNSIAGLAGFVSARQSVPVLAFILSAAAIVGDAIGRIWEAASFRFARFRSCSRPFLSSRAPS
jgi:hypothetical protein